MKEWFKKLNHLYDERPYWSVSIAIAVSSIIGFFIGRPNYGMLFFIIVVFFAMLRREERKCIDYSS